METTVAKDIGRRLKSFCKSKASYVILDDSKGKGGTWTEGGCLILAKALYEILINCGVEAKIKIVTGNAQPQHALVAIRLEDQQEVYLDADGLSTKRQLLDRWMKDEVVAHPIRVRWLPFYPDCMPQPGIEQYRLLKVMSIKIVRLPFVNQIEYAAPLEVV
jgi:hypothetical protein